MRGEQYYLILIDKNGVVYRVSSKPVTLREMDERTTKYENKKELVSEIIKNTGVNITPSSIKEVQILMKPNSKKEEYKVEKGPLYKKDSSVLYVEGVAAKFELLMKDKSFAKEFIKRYKGIKNFNGIATNIEAEIRNGDDYIESLSSLAEKLFNTYKGSRNIYLSMKSYESKKKRNQKRELDSLPNIKEVTEEERREAILKYLQEYEPENLDIDDFIHFEELSSFDAHKTR